MWIGQRCSSPTPRARNRPRATGSVAPGGPREALFRASAGTPAIRQRQSKSVPEAAPPGRYRQRRHTGRIGAASRNRTQPAVRERSPWHDHLGEKGNSWVASPGCWPQGLPDEKKAPHHPEGETGPGRSCTGLSRPAGWPWSRSTNPRTGRRRSRQSPSRGRVRTRES
ncbi:hypothetical protein D3C81_1534790 [compost metagenome]